MMLMVLAVLFVSYLKNEFQAHLQYAYLTYTQTPFEEKYMPIHGTQVLTINLN